jgi:hypothetical protein
MLASPSSSIKTQPDGDWRVETPSPPCCTRRAAPAALYPLGGRDEVDRGVLAQGAMVISGSTIV